MRLPYKIARRALDRAWRLFWTMAGKVALWCHGVRWRGHLVLAGPLDLNVLGDFVIGEGACISSGRRANPVGGSQRTCFVVGRGARLTLGAGVGISNAEIVCMNSISIGPRTLIGGGTRIYDTDFHPLDPSKRNPDQPDAVRSRPVTIGADVFIGGGCLILKGVSIGDGAVIGAGAVVTKSVPSGETWAGNPAASIGRGAPRESVGGERS